VKFFGKILEFLGMVNVLVGLFFGLTDAGGLRGELTLLLVGSCIFFLGWCLER